MILKVKCITYVTTSEMYCMYLRIFALDKTFDSDLIYVVTFSVLRGNDILPQKRLGKEEYTFYHRKSHTKKIKRFDITSKRK